MHNVQQRINSLLTIRSAAENIKGLIRKRLPEETITRETCTTCPNISIPDLDLPFPSDFNATLKSLGLSERLYNETNHKIEEWVHNLQNLHRLNFQRAYQIIVSLPHFQNHDFLASAIEHLRFSYQSAYIKHLPSITGRILSAVSKRNSTCKNVKIPFNNQYTPFLELYFEQNAYPSLPDRQFLARKTLMTMRQIEVWFQNHRARARKEGKVINKLNGPCQPLKERAPFFTIADSTVKITNDDEWRDDESSEGEAPTISDAFPSSPFNQLAPPHAFPTTYPPNLTTDPFPNVNGKFIFPPPVWMRTPAQIRVQTAVPDMDEFISMFSSKLHLRAGSRRKCDAQHPQGYKKPFLPPMVVVPAPAPHPALIRTPYMHSSSKLFTPSFTYLDPVSYSPNPSLPSPLSPSQNTRKPRKLAPFSKRTPSALSTNRTSERPDAFSAFASRTCSFSSAASSQSRSSSSTSVSSAEPATPPLSPNQQEQNPLFADHGYQLLDELFGPEPSQLFNNMAYDTPDFFFPMTLQKDVSHNSLYDLSSMFPPAVAQVHC